jgi:hypothetical protein
MLGSRRGMCPCASRSWRLDGARGDHGEARAEEMRRGGHGARQHKVGRAAARQVSDAWARREAESI